MKIYGEVKVIGYAITVNVYWEVDNGDTRIDEERIIGFCFNKDLARKEYDNLTIDDILSEDEEHSVIEVTAHLEKWEMFDSLNDFNRSEELWKILY